MIEVKEYTINESRKHVSESVMEIIAVPVARLKGLGCKQAELDDLHAQLKPLILAFGRELFRHEQLLLEESER